MNDRIFPLREFVSKMTHAVSMHSTEKKLLPICAELLKSLISRDEWLPDEYAIDDPDQYCQYLLHCDPLERFSVVSFVWSGGQYTPIHNHQTWGVVGVLRGIEESTQFEHDNLNKKLIQGETIRLKPGEIDQFSPKLGDIHQVKNPLNGECSISIHVYGGNIGKIKRQVFDKETGETKEFLSGYSSTTIPNLWNY